MQRLLGAAICVLAVAAAVGPGRADPYNWTGFHLGLSVGGVWDDGRLNPVSTSASLPPFAFTDPTGTIFPPAGTLIFAPGTIPLAGTLRSSAASAAFAGGGQVGRDWQFGSTVFGLEGDVQGLASSSQNFSFAGPASPFGNLGVSAISGSGSIQRNVQGSIRSRLGYAWDRFLLYGSAGIALGDLQTRATYNYAFALSPPLVPIAGISNPANTTASFSQTKLIGGPTLGAGLEYAVNDNVTVGMDYRHTFYGGFALGLGSTPTISSLGSGAIPPIITPGSPITAHYHLDTDAAMLRVNWHFNN